MLNHQKKNIQVAIDGPASSGKSTLAKIIAKKYKMIHIDTGAMYRALTYAALQENVDLSDETALMDLLNRIEIRLMPKTDGQEVWTDDMEVSSEIRTQPVSENVSEVSAHSEVRQEMVKRQRQMSQDHHVVMDGRDIGTVVLPDADLKIFLIASAEERAKRRHQENLQKGQDSDFESVLAQIKKRDAYDTQREHSPLKRADDAISLDTTGLSVQEVVKKVEEKMVECKLIV